MIRVLHIAATHAARIVRGDARDHCRINRRWIGTDFSLEMGKGPIGFGPQYSRFAACGGAIRVEVNSIPQAAKLDEHGIANRLAGKAGTGSAESISNPELGASPHCGNRFSFRLYPYHQLRNEPVETRIGSVGEGAQWIANEPFCWDLRGKNSKQFFVSAKSWQLGKHHLTCCPRRLFP